MNFKIGQEVVCVKTHLQGDVKEGQIYIIKDLRLCSNCKTLDIDVGKINCFTYSGCNCGEVIKTKTAWFHHSRFKPLDELYNKELNEELKEIFTKQLYNI